MISFIIESLIYGAAVELQEDIAKRYAGWWVNGRGWAFPTPRLPRREHIFWDADEYIGDFEEDNRRRNFG